jgi:hypothetical protein
MPLAVTISTKRDQVLQRIVAELTATFQVMDLKVCWRGATLTPPSISLQHAVAQSFVLFHTQPQPRLLLPQSLHEPSFNLSTSSAFCGLGRI